MVSFAPVTDGIAGLWKGVFLKWRSDSSPQSPIDKVKYLPQEAFSELLKIADRQSKLERMLFIKFGEGRPSQDQSTRMKGIIDVVGLMLFGGNDFQQSCGVLQRARIKSGINARLIFETAVKQKDALVAEFLTSHDHPFALESLMYNAHLKKISSVVSIALGAKSDNFAISSSHKQGHCHSGFSPFGPPLFSQQHSFAAGFAIKGSKISASLAELFSGIGMHHDAAGARSCLSTFAQVSYQPYDEVKVNISGLLQNPASGIIKFGMLALPLNGLKVHTGPHVPAQDSSSTNSAGSVAIMLDSEIDEGTKLGVWLEAQKTNPVMLTWGVSLADLPYKEAGWGLKVRGIVKEHLNLQMEGFLRFNLGRNIVVQPGLVYVTEGRTRTPAFIFQSSWCM